MSRTPPPIKKKEWEGPVEEEFDRRWIYGVGGGFLLILIILLILLALLKKPDKNESVAGSKNGAHRESNGSQNDQSASAKANSPQQTTEEEKNKKASEANPKTTDKTSPNKSGKEAAPPSKKSDNSSSTNQNQSGTASDGKSPPPKNQDAIGLKSAPATGASSPNGVTQNLPNQIPISGITSQPVEFFGIKADAGRIVFVIDKSSSMGQARRFTRAVAELTRSINSLNASQSFAVVWFDTLAYPQSSSLDKASDSYKRKQIQSFRSVRPSGGTNPTPAVESALAMKTEAIFLLSDGEVDSHCVTLISQANKNKVPIHTVSFSANVVFLKKIATDSSGFFRVAK